MAQGQYYTRQQLNTLAQRRINARNAAAAAKKAEEERKANDPRRKKLASLTAQVAADRARYDKLFAETGEKKYSEKSDNIRRKGQEKIRTIQRAINKDISISEQSSREKSKRRISNQSTAQRDTLIAENTKKYGAEQAQKIYDTMSPEARDFAYAQLQGRTTPTPNTAAAKDRYNRAQERYVQKVKAINAQAQGTYDEINANWSTATAGEYFDYVRTGQDNRPVPPKREDYGSNLAYANAFQDFSAASFGGSRGGTLEQAETPSQARAIGYGFKAGITADLASADAMGLDARNSGAANLAYGAGQIAYLPARYYAAAGAGRVIGAVTGAGVGLGGAVGKGVGAAATIGGRYPAAVTVGSSVGKFVGGVGFAAPPVLLGTYAVTELQSAPVTAELERRGIDRGQFRAAYSEALSQTGGFAELSPLAANRERFNANFAASLSRRGIEPSQSLVGLGNQQRVASGVGDAAGLVFAGAGANVLGSRFLAQTGTGQLYRTPIGVFSGGGFRAIGAAGILEGGISSYGQNVARFEPLDNRRAAIGGAFGGVSAGLLGGFVAGTAAAGQRSASSFYEGVGFAADPSEFGSDVLTASNPAGNARFTGVFATNAPPLSQFQGGSRELQPTLTDDFGIAPPVQPNKPRSRGGRPRAGNPFVNSQPFARSEPNPLVDIPPAPQPNPVVGVPVSSNPSTNPFVPVNPAPNVPVAPNPFVPVNPNPNVPSQPNPIVDVPVTKLFFPPLGRGSRIPRRSKGGFGSGFSKARYTPSFAALELGIGASKINTSRSFSGFEIRPFLSPNKKKKKKGKTTRRSKRRVRAPYFSLGASPI